MLGAFDFDVIFRSWQYLFLVGMSFTIELTLEAMAGGIVIGTMLAMMRLSSNKLVAMLAGGYVNFIRSIPLVLVIFWFYFLTPLIGAWIIGAKQPIQVGAFLSSLITFILFEAAYFCEIMRAGILSIPFGQTSASQALGMNYWKTMRYVILPQAFQNMLPMILTQIIILFQDASLVYVVSITDFVGAASKVAQRDNRLVEMYVFVAVIYFLMCFGLSLLVNKIKQKIVIHQS